jgi:hypothetical protein
VTVDIVGGSAHGCCCVGVTKLEGPFLPVGSKRQGGLGAHLTAIDGLAVSATHEYCCCVHVSAAGVDEAGAGPKVDAGVQVYMDPSTSLLPPDATAPPPDLLAAAAPPLAAAAAAQRRLGQYVQDNRQAAAVLAGLSAWLPQDVVEEAAAAAAAADSAAADAHTAEGSSEQAAAAVAGGSSAQGGGASVSGVSLWREEARVAVSVVELVSQLEETWGGVLDKLEQAQVRGLA